MDGYGEHYGAGRVKPTGLSLAHTPPSVYDGQKKEDLKRSRVYVPVDKVIPMDRVNEGVNPVHALRTPQVMPATKRCSTHKGTQRSLDEAAVSNRKQQYEDNRDRRNNLGMDRVDRPLWSASATSARAMELSVEWKRVCNSTSSVFASSTISSPSIAEILLCVSAVIKIQMDRDVCVPVEAREQFPYFLQYPSSTSNATANVPSLEAINVFLHDMFVAGGFSPECNIIALVYIDRVISSTGLPIHQYNWCGIVCAAYLLAQKVWDDSSLNTASFAKLFPIFTLDQVRQFEKQLIYLLDYQAMVTSQLYTRYYFELRELFDQLQKGSGDLNVTFPLRPLELWRAKKLQLVSDSFRMQRRDASMSYEGSPLPGKSKPDRLESAWNMYRGFQDESPGSESPDYPTQALDDNDITYTPRGRYVQS